MKIDKNFSLSFLVLKKIKQQIKFKWSKIYNMMNYII